MLEDFRHLGTTLTYKISIQEEIKKRFMLENSCNNSVQNPLSSILLPKNTKFKYRTIFCLLFCVSVQFVSHIEGGKKAECESMVLKTLFGPKTDEVTGVWRKLHNGELNNLFYLPSIVRLITWRKMMWAGHIADIGERIRVYGVSVWNSEGKRPLGRPRFR